jgi:pimeloyl-ACP methyl ester carboxylesterase
MLGTAVLAVLTAAVSHRTELVAASTLTPDVNDKHRMPRFRTVCADGVQLFCREAGEPGAPKLLLLGGSPSSSYQFRHLMPALADRFHLVSFDYPGFGYSQTPDPREWDYTFDHLAEIVDEALLAIDFAGPMGWYMHGYGGPIGNRLIALHPDWMQWQIIQNANSYEDGFTEVWDGIRSHHGADTDTLVKTFLAPEAVEASYLMGHPDPARISPDNWMMDLQVLARPNAHRVQLDLLQDYSTDVERYPTWQARLRRDQPKTLILWGQKDRFFSPAGGQAYLRDLPDAKLVALDSGHFALEDCLTEITAGITDFYDEHVKNTRRHLTAVG